MPTLDRRTQLTTRLANVDLERFRALATKKSLQLSELLREAALHYLDYCQMEERQVIEGAYAQQLKASTNRICALLAKTAVGVETLTEFMSRLEDSEALLDECRAKATKKVAAALTDEERMAGQAMSRKIAG